MASPTDTDGPPAQHDPASNSTAAGSAPTASATVPPPSAARLTSPAPLPLPPSARRQIWVVTGPAGCGKTTVATALAARYGLPFLEGDNFHPPANIAKMSAGHPLTDADRWGWLRLVLSAATSTLAPPHRAVVLTCSALRRAYRDVLRSAPPGIETRFVFLALAPEELERRVREREGHYMKAGMVRSQLEVLEEPGEGEGDVLVVDAGREEGAVREQVWRGVEGVMRRDG